MRRHACSLLAAAAGGCVGVPVVYEQDVELLVPVEAPGTACEPSEGASPDGQIVGRVGPWLHGGDEFCILEAVVVQPVVKREDLVDAFGKDAEVPGRVLWLDGGVCADAFDPARGLQVASPWDGCDLRPTVTGEVRVPATIPSPWQPVGPADLAPDLLAGVSVRFSPLDLHFTSVEEALERLGIEGPRRSFSPALDEPRPGQDPSAKTLGQGASVALAWETRGAWFPEGQVFVDHPAFMREVADSLPGDISGVSYAWAVVPMASLPSMLGVDYRFTLRYQLQLLGLELKEPEPALR